MKRSTNNICAVSEKPKDVSLEASPALEKDSETKVSRKELPEYLKQRLKARGILKNEKVDGGSITIENVSSICSCYLQAFVCAFKLPLSFIIYGNTFLMLSYLL